MPKHNIYPIIGPLKKIKVQNSTIIINKINVINTSHKETDFLLQLK